MQNRISLPRVHIMTPVPGTPLYDEMESAGRIISRDFDRFSGGQVVYKPRLLDPEELQRGYWRLYERLFTPGAILKRLRNNVARLNPFMRAFVLGANVHYRNHIQNRITPGIV